MDRPVTLYDTTLRDGTQGENITLSLADKLRVARMLDASKSNPALPTIHRPSAKRRSVRGARPKPNRSSTTTRWCRR